MKTAQAIKEKLEYIFRNISVKSQKKYNHSIAKIVKIENVTNWPTPNTPLDKYEIDGMILFEGGRIDYKVQTRLDFIDNEK